MNYIQNGPGEGPIFIFSHGAGADMHSDFMILFAEKLSEKGIRVIRFNFPYMIKRQEDGKRRPPDRAPKLLAAFENCIKSISQDNKNTAIVIGGKSMGGRMSSLVLANNVLKEKADQLPILGAACLGFPFHAPKKEPKDRLDHLQNLTEPLLVVQGTRDNMGTREEVEGYIKEERISSTIQLRWLEDGNHDLKPRIVSGFSQQNHIDSAVDLVAEFIFSISKKKQEESIT